MKYEMAFRSNLGMDVHRWPAAVVFSLTCLAIWLELRDHHRPVQEREKRAAMVPTREYQVGMMLKSRPLPTRIRCKIYDAPFPQGRYLETLLPSTAIGPILEVRVVGPFVVVRTHLGWINVWKRPNVYFASAAW